MEEEIKARYRNKVGKIIIEVFNGEKWLYVKTLSNPLIEFNAECLAKLDKKCLDSTHENEINNDKKFVYASLRELSPEQKDKTLEEGKLAINKLMNDILKK